MSTRQFWSRRDKRTAYRAGHFILSKPYYPGEPYGQRVSFGRFKPEDRLFDGATPFEYVEVVRGRRAMPGWAKGGAA